MVPGSLVVSLVGFLAVSLVGSVVGSLVDSQVVSLVVSLVGSLVDSLLGSLLKSGERSRTREFGNPMCAILTIISPPALEGGNFDTCIFLFLITKCQFVVFAFVFSFCLMYLF